MRHGVPPHCADLSCFTIVESAHLLALIEEEARWAGGWAGGPTWSNGWVGQPKSREGQFHPPAPQIQWQGIISWGNHLDFVSKEGGEIFPWRNLGALVVRCVREAVVSVSFGIRRGCENFPLRSLPRRNSPHTK